MVNNQQPQINLETEGNDGYQGILDWRQFLLYMGYNINIRDDMERLVKNFDWIEKERLKSERSASRKSAFFVTLITTLITGVITVAGSWILKTITSQ